MLLLAYYKHSSVVYSSGYDEDIALLLALEQGL